MPLIHRQVVASCLQRMMPCVSVVDAGTVMDAACVRQLDELLSSRAAPPSAEPGAFRMQPGLQKSGAGVLGEVVLATRGSAAVRLATAVLLAVIVSLHPNTLVQSSGVPPLVVLAATQVRLSTSSTPKAGHATKHIGILQVSIIFGTWFVFNHSFKVATPPHGRVSHLWHHAVCIITACLGWVSMPTAMHCCSCAIVQSYNSMYVCAACMLLAVNRHATHGAAHR